MVLFWMHGMQQVYAEQNDEVYKVQKTQMKCSPLRVKGHRK